jgi:hypothetical protein
VRDVVTIATVLFPWRPGCQHRDAAAGWVHAGWATHLPDIPALTSLDVAPGGTLDVDGQWCKARHVHTLASAATTDILIISDVDVWTTPTAIRAAITAIRDGWPWAIPYTTLHRLTQNATARTIASPHPTTRAGAATSDHEQRPYQGHTGGGITVIHRATLTKAPMDPRFLGWGHEDDSWAVALHRLTKRPWRGRHDALHLWHPPQARATRETGSPASVALAAQYTAAGVQHRRGNRDPLQDLLSEARERLDELDNNTVTPRSGK